MWAKEMGAIPGQASFRPRCSRARSASNLLACHGSAPLVLDTPAIIVGIFGLVGLGYASRRTGLLAASVGRGLTDFVFKAAIPILLFDTLSSADFQELSPWRIWAAYFIPFALIWACGRLTIRHVFGRDERAGIVAGGSAAFSNGVLIGLPLMQAAFGEAGTIYLIVIVAVQLPVMMLVSVVLHEFATSAESEASGLRGSRGEAARRLALALATHPILLSILAGLLWRLTGIQAPGVALSILDPLARAAGPLALFAAGMALLDYGVARQVRPAFAIAALKLFVMPALVFACAQALALPPLGIAVVTLTAACPTGVNAFLIARRLGAGQALASNAMLISTAGAVVTVSLWLVLLQRLLG